MKKHFVKASLSVLISLLLSAVCIADGTDPGIEGVDSVWHNGSEWSPSPIDPNLLETVALAGADDQGVFAIQLEDGVTKVVRFVWSTTQSQWVRDIIDVGSFNKIHVDIVDNTSKRDSVFVIVDDGTGITDLYSIWHKTNVGWQYTNVLTSDDNGTRLYNNLAMDTRGSRVWCAGQGGLFAVWYSSGWHLGGYINEYNYAVLANNNYPFTLVTDPEVITPPDPGSENRIIGAVAGGGLHSVNWNGSSWYTGIIDPNTVYNDVTVHRPNHIIAALAEGSLQHIYWSNELGYWVKDTFASGVKYMDVEANREDVFWAARAGGGLDRYHFNGYNWIRTEISPKEYIEISNAYTSSDGLGSVFGGPNVVTPVCGDLDHLSPFMDFNGDCVVDASDFGLFATQWLLNTQP